MKKIIVMFVLNAFFVSSCKADQIEKQEDKIIKGLYISYKDAEYARSFSLCSDEDVWLVEENDVFKKLADTYKSSAVSKYGELYIEVKGKLIKINKMQFPHSHYIGTLVLSKVVRYSTDDKIISGCRG